MTLIKAIVQHVLALILQSAKTTMEILLASIGQVITALVITKIG